MAQIFVRMCFIHLLPGNQFSSTANAYSIEPATARHTTTHDPQPNPTLAIIGLGYVGLPVRDGGLEPTTDPRRIASADFLIIAVPTPIDAAHQPDFGPLIGASTSVGQNMKRGAVVIYESTVYPGDKEHTLTKILKVVSGDDAETLDKLGLDTTEVLEAAGTEGRMRPSP